MRIVPYFGQNVIEFPDAARLCMFTRFNTNNSYLVKIYWHSITNAGH